jgi:hypothetical protein
LLLALACAPAPQPEPEPPPSEGEFDLLTYNVAGLPDGINDDQSPEVNIPKISPKLNAYDMVLVQEDFAYTFELRAELEFEFESFPKEDIERFMNDGLNRFSDFAFDPDVDRQMWTECFGGTDNGSDCLAEKGFSFARMTLSEGVDVDVYNLHMDAGGSAEDHAARTSDVAQLLSYIEETSADRAVIVAGDTNLKPRDDVDDASLIAELNGALEDVCLTLECPEPNRIDRIYLRSGGGVALEPLSWGLAEEMVDEAGGPLSDHDGVVSRIRWSTDP